MNQAIFSTCWFAPVVYYALINKNDISLIEGAENYIKQSYRNRCQIAATNGVQTLSIPIENSGRTFIKDIKISNHGDWQRIHWNSITSAYNSSPFFEYYADDIQPFFEKKERWLFDMNEQIRQTICNLISINPTVIITTEYKKDYNFYDYRNTIQPKSPIIDKIEEKIIKPYYQVFNNKHGFLKNLSILDLLFNMGPESVLYL